MSEREHIDCGYWGRILHVDLDTGEIDYETLDDEVYRQFLGGVGLAAKVLWDRMEPGVDPLGPDNLLGFVPGLLTDTGSLFTGRFLVVGKSPATGGWGDANCGGYFSPFLKRCGVDGVFVRGISDKPVYLRVDADGAELLDATDLWGLDTIETEDKLKQTHGKRAQIACIGPAGEKRSLMAGVCNDGGRIAARGGLGGVMGSKRLKAVVAMGNRRIKVADKPRMKELTKEFRGHIGTDSPMNKVLSDFLLGRVGWLNRINPVAMRQPNDLWRLLLARFGTPALTAMSSEGGDSPIKNWGGIPSLDYPLRRAQRLGAESVTSHEVKKYGCYSCPLKCGGVVKVEGGPYPIEEMHKPEYETICAFGALLLHDDLPTVFKINDLCNRGGVDTISVGGTVAFAIECFEAGLLTAEDTDGLELAWGDSASILELTRRIIHREGIGDLLADGVKVAAARIGDGADRFAVHAGGVELPMHDPKFDPGYGVSYMCEPTPGRHTISSWTYLELQNLERQFKRAAQIPMLTTKKRKSAPEGGEAMAVDSFYKMLVDATGACFFGTQVGGPIPLCDWMNAATGWSLSPDEYLVAGERIEQLRHCFNVREGLNPARDFKPHGRAYGDPPQPRGTFKGTTLDADGWARSFYGAMHWSQETGRPSRSHLEGLGLAEVADTLYAAE